MTKAIESDLYDKISQTRQLMNRNIFLTVLEAGMSQIKVPADSMSGGAHLLVDR